MWEITIFSPGWYSPCEKPRATPWDMWEITNFDTRLVFALRETQGDALGSGSGALTGLFHWGRRIANVTNIDIWLIFAR